MTSKRLLLEEGAVFAPAYQILAGRAEVDLEGVGITPDVSAALDSERLRLKEDTVILTATQFLSNKP